MDRYLLDTNVLLNALTKPTALSKPIIAALQRGPLALSVIAYVEVVLKAQRGQIDIGDARTWWAEALSQLNGSTLRLQAEHISELWLLPPIHGDPFDRLLIAQAMAENLTLLSRDTRFPEYRRTGLKLID